ncbi:MAG: hypothetical protein P8047_17265 [Gammaproteobacteria bacterium]
MSRAIAYAIIGYLLTHTLQVYASTYLLINSGDGGIYRQFRQELSALLNPQDDLISTNLENFSKHINTPQSEKFTAVITTGIEAAIAVSRVKSRSKIIMSMLPRKNYMALSKSGEIVCKPRHCQVIFLDQPVSRQLRLIKLAFPGKNHIAVITGKNSAELSRRISRAANKFGLIIHRIRVSSEDTLISALNQDLAGSDILMAVPDPQVYNRNTARAVLLATFNQHINIDIPDAGYLTQRLELHEKP